MLNKRSLILFIAFSLALLAYFPSAYHNSSSANDVVAFQRVLLKKEQKAIEALQQIKNWDRKKLLGQHTIQLNKAFEENGFSFFVFHNNKLDYWSEDITTIHKKELLSSKPIYRESNAWQRKISLTNGDTTYIALLLIQHDYSLQNRFLVNSFQEDFQFNRFKGITLSGKENYKILSSANEPIFYLEAENNPNSTESDKVLALVFIACILLIILLLPKQLSGKDLPQYMLSILLVVSIRIILFFIIPDFWAGLPLFQSSSFAISSLIPSLGDLLLHLLSLVAIIYWLKKSLKGGKNKWMGMLFMLLTLLFSWFSIELIGTSIASSQIKFDLNNLLQLNSLSLFAYFSFILLFIATILLADSSINFINNQYSKIQRRVIIACLLLSYVVVIIYSNSPLIATWILPVFLLMQWFSTKSKGKTIGISILLLICCAGSLAFWTTKKIDQKKSNKARIFSQKLAEEEDPVAEYLFEQAQNEIQNDMELHQKLKNYWENKEVIDDYLKQNYFNAYWDSYEILFSICNPKDSLYISSWDASVSCIDYFQNRIRLEGTAVSSNNLFQLKNLAGRVDYIGEIPIQVDSNNYKYIIYVELSSNYFNENEGYPELLLDAKSKTKNINLSDYDYAVYENGVLVFKNGAYTYSTSLKINELSPGEHYEYSTSKAHHTVYQKNKDIAIVLSYKAATKIDFFTAFAYLLVLFSLVFIVCTLSLSEFPFHLRPQWSDFSFKIQLFLIGSLLIALVLVAIGSTYYIKQQYQLKNSNNLGEKLRSIKLEMENKIGGEEILASGLKSYTNSLLLKFSNVFYTDINFYDKNGKLFASSRPEIFNKDLKSELMNPIAFQEIVRLEKAEWVQQERIGKMEYLSAYIPFKNYNNEVLGYLNLPYFVKQGKLQEEISNFLVSTINIYVGVFALALFISILLINQLSKPLRLIRKQIAKLKLGSAIELIEWKSKDEIGALVNEYNRIAIELNESAEQLAQSEREGAWREMAKQVAHEIKNPLTPMKLSIQHLQMAANQNSPDIGERIKRTSQVLIEQIETLSNIATAFSSFAKLPDRSLTQIDLIPILKNMSELYSGDARIDLQISLDTPTAIIKADKDQLLRLLNNLLKNAVQACAEQLDKKIGIEISAEGSHFKILIQDNGVGIPINQLDRIFEPNFTTKSSGTGLGLAMTKSMVEQMNGTIKASSEEGVGTTFLLHFPIA
ncbi:MAG: HAMP domain-containing sensor histidine kinase [Vicingaceae bacterium]